MICVTRIGQADESRQVAGSCTRYRACERQLDGRCKKICYEYTRTSMRRVFTDVQSKSASTLFYSYPDHHRKSSKAEIRFVYRIFGIEEIGENAISFPHAFCPAFYATKETFSDLSSNRIPMTRHVNEKKSRNFLWPKSKFATEKDETTSSANGTAVHKSRYNEEFECPLMACCLF